MKTLIAYCLALSMIVAFGGASSAMAKSKGKSSSRSSSSKSSSKSSSRSFRGRSTSQGSSSRSLKHRPQTSSSSRSRINQSAARTKSQPKPQSRLSQPSRLKPQTKTRTPQFNSQLKSGKQSQARPLKPTFKSERKPSSKPLGIPKFKPGQTPVAGKGKIKRPTIGLPKSSANKHGLRFGGGHHNNHNGHNHHNNHHGHHNLFHPWHGSWGNHGWGWGHHCNHWGCGHRCRYGSWDPWFSNCNGYYTAPPVVVVQQPVVQETVNIQPIVIEPIAPVAAPVAAPIELTAAAGGTITIPQAGLGADEGQVMMQVGAITLPTRVSSWKNEQIELQLPFIGVAGSTRAQLHVYKADRELLRSVEFELTQPAAPPQAGQ